MILYFECNGEMSGLQRGKVETIAMSTASAHKLIPVTKRERLRAGDGGP